MKRLMLYALVPLLLAASSALAAGINLGWNDCPGGGTFSLTESFLCDTNTGVHTLVGSFISPAGIVAMDANEVVIDVQTGGVNLAPWWTFGTGQCRPTSMSGNFDFTAGPFTCYDYWQGGAIGGTIWSHLAPANMCRIKVIFALPAEDPRITAVPEGTEVYSFKLNINNAKSVGLGACAGCSDEACIVFKEIVLNQSAPNPRITITNPATSSFAMWHGWTSPDPGHQCPGTPTRATTWGSIKAMYR